RFSRDWSSDVCSSDLGLAVTAKWHRWIDGHVTIDPDRAAAHLLGDLSSLAHVAAPYARAQTKLGTVHARQRVIDACISQDRKNQIGRAACREKVCSCA